MMTSASRQQSFLSLVLSLILATALGCGDDGGGDDPVATAGLQWFETCGDPVCGGYSPTPGATLCTNEAVGDGCSPSGSACEVTDNECNVDLVCSDSDPKASGCPISRRSLKRDIHYLTATERADLTRELLDTRLAVYRYRSEPERAGTRLGFIIDDQDQSPAVRGDGQRVDLYGYASMAVAAIQTQAETITSLEQQVAALRAELATMRGDQASGLECGHEAGD